VHLMVCARCGGTVPDRVQHTMNQHNARPSGRSGGRPGGRRRSSGGRPGGGHDRSRRDHDDTPARTGSLTGGSGLPPVDTPTGFAALGVPEAVDAGLAAAGFAQPFAIQLEAIPVAMRGHDVCGRAKTGSGKTLAFGVPMLARMQGRAEPRSPLGLVLVPTRELAVQVAEVLDPVAATAGLRVLPVYGGVGREPQIAALAAGAELVVAHRYASSISSNQERSTCRRCRSCASTKLIEWPTMASPHRWNGCCGTAPVGTRQCCFRRP